jgi:Flp pilus assembly protein TadG
MLWIHCLDCSSHWDREFFDVQQPAGRRVWNGAGAVRVGIAPMRQTWKWLRQGSRCVAALETALLAPVFIMLLAFTVDFSLYLYAGLQLSNGVTAGATYAVANGQLIVPNSAGCATATPPCLTVSSFRSNVSTLVQNAVSPNISSPTVYYNSSSNSGTDTDSIYYSCYCPDTTQSASSQAAVTCGTACADGTQPGSFVVVQASSTYAPLFPTDVWLPNGTLTKSAWVRVQ